MKLTNKLSRIIVFILLFPILNFAQIPAFPGAEGFGANTPGGRGGRVIEVTNTNDSGPGSFRQACEASGPRIVVFKVGGTITLQSTIKITEPYITIAGQSAPGGGICLKGNGSGKTTLTLKTHDIVLRYLRIRPGPGGESDGLAIQTEEAHDIIIDHCSITWGVDESSSIYTGNANKKVKNVTYQWNIISDALDCSTHGEGCHSKGLLLQYCDKISVHHNLFANNGGRSPMILSGEIDVRNNVIYNWGGSAVKIENRHGDVFMNYVKNYIAPGEDSDMSENGIQVKTDGISMYLKDNIAEHVRPDNSYPEDAIVNYREPATLVTTVYSYPSVTTTSANQAYEDVLDNSGAILPQRDSADQMTVDGVRNRTGRLIDDPADVGGYPNLASDTAPIDSDADGMPDDWEIAQGFDPNNPSDGSADQDGDGYTNVEEYLNNLVNNNTPNVDCNGDEVGTAYIDDCGNCVGGNTNNEPCTTDCNGDTGGTAYIDDCGNCVEGNTNNEPCVTDCNGDAGGTAYLDDCGNCVGGNTNNDPCIPPDGDTIEVVVNIKTKKDDAEERTNSGKVDWDSSDLELTEDNGNKQIVGLRFREISIPQGAIIKKAHITFTTDERSSEACNLIIKGQDINNARRFKTSSYNISKRRTTDAKVNWEPIPWNTTGEQNRTPNIKTIIQEIVNRKGWSTNNNMVIIIEGTGKRTAESYDGSPNQAAMLKIEYTIPQNFTGNTEIANTEIMNTGQWTIHPNPMKDIFFVDLKKTQNRVRIYDVSGNKMYSKKAEKETLQIDVTSWPPGIYFVKLWNGKEQFVKKIIKKQ